jgi:signal transduction histidine kinase
MDVKEVEIEQIPPLSPGQISLVNLHSVLNVLSVLHGELTLLGFSLADDPDLLRPALEICDRVRADLVDPEASLRHAATIHETSAEIERMVLEQIARHPEKAALEENRESLENMRSVFRVFEVRAREILARAREPDAWQEFVVDDLRADFRTVFDAIEKNSRGRFGIAWNIAQQQDKDYYLDLAIEGDGGGRLSMPPVFKDVMRDLLANARKYTAPGGMISAGLHASPEALRFTVQDSGRGIPPEELESVVHFGRRGSNVAEVRTMGAGFGLTKAFLVTKQFGGRFWIRSALGAGTRIRIEIPRPGHH